MYSFYRVVGLGVPSRHPSEYKHSRLGDSTVSPLSSP